MTPRTIDNLGFEASQRYAEHQQRLSGQEHILRDGKVVFATNTIDVTKPANHNEIIPQTALKSGSWALFTPPMHHGPSKRLFTHDLLPAIGGEEKITNLKQKVLHLQKREDRSPFSKEDQWQSAQEEEREDQEQKAVLSLLDCILQLLTCTIYVYVKRAQYHKG